MKRVYSILALVAILFVLVPVADSCRKSNPREDPEKPEPTPERKRETSFDGTYYHDLPYDDWETSVLKRADAMLNCPWTPLQDVKKSGGGSTFPKGQKVQPIPYGGSGTTTTYYTYVGLNVSFYTFLSCVNNPKSNFYKSSVWDSFGRPFYGTVCTAFTAYCWGAPSRFDSVDVYAENVPYLKKFSVKGVDELELTDGVCWYSQQYNAGHMLIITDVARDKDGKVLRMTTTEANDGRVHSTEYTVAELQKKFDDLTVPVKYYRYDRDKYGKYLDQPSFSEQERVSGYTFPDALCPDRGDRVSYGKGTPVTINILSDKFSTIELYKDDTIHETRNLNGTDDVTYSNLPVGMYKARLVKDSQASSFTCFQIGEVAFTATSQDGKVLVRYNDPNSEVQFLTINSSDNSGNVRRYVEKVKNGEYLYSWPLNGATHVRVHFAGKYSTYKGNSVKIQ